MVYKNIVVEKKESVAKITINRPEVLNALNTETLLELSKAFDELNEDKKVKVVMLTGAGKAFIAGADIKQMKDMTSLEAKTFAETGHNLLRKIEESRLVVIAAVNGYALGGGCEVMMACDIVVAAKNAKIGQPEINLGIHPGFGGTQRLPRLVGRLKAKEILLTGDSLSAEEAHRIGLVNRVVEDEKLMEEVERLANQIAGKSGVQTAFIKTLVNKGLEVDLQTACSLEISYFATSFSTKDQKEGMTAFLEKRKPVFRGK
ncbi:MAG TPA: crotonase [Thermoplasmatales archaeon]|nr:crotonase [Thermoplasmatales archaeon]